MSKVSFLNSMRLLGTIAIALASAQAWALPINSPVPSNAYIQFAGLDWAWGSPCPDVGCDGAVGGVVGPSDLSFQAMQGWRLPTAAELELLSADFADNFVFPGANVPLGGTDPVSGANFQLEAPPGDAACATPYFNGTANWCDWGPGSYWAGLPGLDSVVALFADQLYVRQAVLTVPEPSSLALFGASLIGLIYFRRRRNAV